MHNKSFEYRRGNAGAFPASQLTVGVKGFYMKASKLSSASIVFILAVMTFSPVYAQKGSNPIESTIPAEGYNDTGFPFPSAMRFSIGECTYYIPFDTEAKRSCNQKSDEHFRLPVQDGATVWVRLEYLPYRGDLILVYDTQNDRDDYGAGMVTRLDGIDLSAKWSTEIYGSNTCPCLREGSYLYVTGLNYIGKIDLESGEYVWSHRLDALINSFGPPKLVEEKVVFTENIQGASKSKPKVIEVNKFTGKFQSE